MTGILDPSTSEAAVLGAALLSDHAADTVCARLDAGCWTREAHRAVYAAVAALRNGGRAADTTTVTEVLARQGRLDEAGGPAGLHDLTVACPSPTSVGHYIDLVLDHTRRRQLAATATQLAQGAVDPSRTLGQTLTQAREQLDGIRPAGRRLSVYTDDELDRIPPVEWLLWGVLPARGLTVVYGRPKDGKSFVVLDWSLSLLAGLDWFGLKTSKLESVVYVAAEGASGITDRRKAWRTHRGVHPSGFHLVASPLSLADQADVGELDQLVGDRKAGLLVIDTWARCMGGDENSSKDAGDAVRALDRIRDRHGCSVLVVHHTGHADSSRGRGSSALLGALDSQVKVTKDGDRVTVRPDEAKDARVARPVVGELVSAGPSVALAWSSSVVGETDEEVKDRLRTVLRGRPETVVQLDKIAAGRNDLVMDVLEEPGVTCLDPLEQPARYRYIV